MTKPCRIVVAFGRYRLPGTMTLAYHARFACQDEIEGDNPKNSPQARLDGVVGGVTTYSTRMSENLPGTSQAYEQMRRRAIQHCGLSFLTFAYSWPRSVIPSMDNQAWPKAEISGKAP